MSKVYVDPTAIIDEAVSLKSGTKIWHFVHIMKDSKIGKDCILADYVYIGRGVKIGNKVKLENRTTICENMANENIFWFNHFLESNHKDILGVKNIESNCCMA
jgi:UDP-2-acetamido-3-amino-2,3-dideoxy-glucuronate N-acetyltransferase